MTAPMPQKGPSFLGQVFGGPTPQSGDPQAAHRAEQQALIEAGLTLASHRGPGSLLASLGAGQKAYAQASQAAAYEAKMQRQAQTQQMLQDSLLESANDPESLVTLARQVLAYGDDDGAKTILDMAKVQASLKAQKRTQVVGDSKSGYKLIDLDTGDVIADITQPLANDGRTLDEALAATMSLQKNFQTVISGQGFDADAVLVKQLRSATPGALKGSGEAQEAFFRALLRIQNPGLRRVSDDEVFAQADQLGLTTGKIGQALDEILNGNYDPSVISAWIPTVNQIIKDRIKIFDGHLRQFRDQAGQFGINPSAIYDYFAEERYGSIPGVQPEEGRALNRYFNGVPF